MQGIERSALDQTFQDPSVDFAQIDAAEKIHEGCKFSFHADFHYGFNRRFPDIFYGGKAETDVASRNAEILLGFIDVRRQNIDAHFLAVGHVPDNLVPVVFFAGQKRRHEGDGIMGLQIGRLVGDHRVGGAVRLVETVFGEVFHLIPYDFCLVLVDRFLFRAFKKTGFLLFHRRYLLFPHHFAQRVGLRHGISSNDVGDLHDLFLVKDDAVGFFEDRLQLGKLIGNLLLSMLAGDKIGNHLHRSRPVGSNQRDDVFDAVRLEIDQQVFHPGAFQLENTVGFPLCEQTVGFFIIERKIVHVNIDMVGIPDEIHGVLNDRQRLETQKIKFGQPDGFDILHRILGNPVIFFGRKKRNTLDQRNVGYHNAGGVHGRMPVEAFQNQRQRQHFVDLRVLPAFFLKTRLRLERIR